jgi:CBS domain-containing protein
MTTVRDILRRKGAGVLKVPEHSTVLEATRYMNRQRVGAVVVTDEDRLVGIFTERDVLQRVVAEERPPGYTRVGDVMTSRVICCAPETEIDEASRIMKDHRIRHVPVCDADGRLLGLVSIGDVNAQHASEQEAQIQYLNEYLYASV